jgi:hypothetical protein
MSERIWFTARQVLLVALAALAYFGVRGLTESDIADANQHADGLLRLEKTLGLDIELGLQAAVGRSEWLVDLANWIYIWAHWPLVASTLIYLAIYRRSDYFELRNAMFISGAIGLVIFATYAVTPPRLFGSEYIDTVTERSISYRVLQPPNLVNKYAAVPSLHFGWNLLVGLSWRGLTKNPILGLAGIGMPLAMAFAVVATANHWTLDVFAGAAVALSGLVLERARQLYVSQSHVPQTTRLTDLDKSRSSAGMCAERSSEGAI